MRIFAFLCLVCILVSCDQKQALAYKYVDLPQEVMCNKTPKALLNEALHSFENDLITKYDSIEKKYPTAYARFVIKGIMGREDYKGMASAHSHAIKDALLEEGILVKNGGTSNLNYNHPDVKCVIENLEDKDMTRAINALLQTGNMDPKMFDTKLRGVGRNIKTKPYQATYIALDGYYQYMVDIAPDAPDE